MSVKSIVLVKIEEENESTTTIFFLAPKLGSMNLAAGSRYVFRSPTFGDIKSTSAKRGIDVVFLHFCNFLSKMPH